MLDQITAEIPAMLDFLYYRDIFHPKVSRLWFKKDWFITEQLKVILQTTKNRLDKVIEEIIKDMFLNFKLNEMKLDLKWLVKEVNMQSKFKHDVNEVRDYLKKRKGMKPLPSAKIRIPIGFETNPQTQELDIAWFNTRSRAYLFKVDEWLSEEELKELEEKEEESQKEPTKKLKYEVENAPF